MNDGNTNISMTRGDTLAFTIEIDGLGTLELDSIYFSCKKDLDSEKYVFQKSLGDGITRISNNKYSIKLATEDTENLRLGGYFYDLQITLGDSVLTVLKGKLEITFDVTRGD